jgi:hypothetical protein
MIMLLALIQIWYVYLQDDFVCRIKKILETKHQIHWIDRQVFNFHNKWYSHSMHKIITLSRILNLVIGFRKMNISTKKSRQKQYHLHFMTFFLGFCFKNAYTKLKTLLVYRKSNCANAILTVRQQFKLLHKCFVKQACNSHSITHLDNITYQTLGLPSTLP